MLRGHVADYHELPKIRDRLSYVYVEHARIDKTAHAVGVWDTAGETELPVSALTVLMLGPGTTISHGAVKVLADHGCLVVWCGEENIRFYAFGTGGTHSSARLLHQAAQVLDPERRQAVCRRMYAIRFAEVPAADVTIEQLRGMEGARVRHAYRRWAEHYGIEWQGRSYDRADWSAGDPANKALSSANACLYGLCHAAVVAAGYSPALGFIHTGTERAFVLDLADIYKVDITIPAAFKTVAAGEADPARAVRLACRDMFRETKLLQRILPDIERLLGPLGAEAEADEASTDADPTAPHALWTPSAGGEEADDGDRADR